jgi:hypothetical protein
LVMAMAAITGAAAVGIDITNPNPQVPSNAYRTHR